MIESPPVSTAWPEAGPVQADAAPQGTGLLEAWFEAYAEAYTGVRLAKQIAPWKWKRDHEVLREYCQWWWT